MTLYRKPYSENVPEEFIELLQKEHALWVQEQAEIETLAQQIEYDIADKRFGVYGKFFRGEGGTDHQNLFRILRIILPFSLYRTWEAIVSLHPGDNQPCPEIAEIARAVGRSERKIAADLRTFQELKLLEIAPSKRFRGNWVLEMRFAGLYKLAYQYMKWERARSFIPPDRNYAPILEAKPKLFQWLMQFNNYKKAFLNKKPGPRGKRKASEQNDIATTKRTTYTCTLPSSCPCHSDVTAPLPLPEVASDEQLSTALEPCASQIMPLAQQEAVTVEQSHNNLVVNDQAMEPGEICPPPEQITAIRQETAPTLLAQEPVLAQQQEKTSVKPQSPQKASVQKQVKMEKPTQSTRKGAAKKLTEQASQQEQPEKKSIDNANTTTQNLSDGTGGLPEKPEEQSKVPQGDRRLQLLNRALEKSARIEAEQKRRIAQHLPLLDIDIDELCNETPQTGAIENKLESPDMVNEMENDGQADRIENDDSARDASTEQPGRRLSLAERYNRKNYQKVMRLLEEIEEANQPKAAKQSPYTPPPNGYYEQFGKYDPANQSDSYNGQRRYQARARSSPRSYSNGSDQRGGQTRANQPTRRSNGAQSEYGGRPASQQEFYNQDQQRYTEQQEADNQPQDGYVERQQQDYQKYGGEKPTDPEGWKRYAHKILARNEEEQLQERNRRRYRPST